MGFKDAIKTCFGKYATFSGRATRSEYWWFFLFHALLSLVPLIQLATLATIVPMLAVSWRRMHDVGKSGFYLFLPFISIPFVMIDGFVGSESGIGPVSFVGFGLSLLATIYVFVLLASRGRDGVASSSAGFSPSPA